MYLRSRATDGDEECYHRCKGQDCKVNDRKSGPLGDVWSKKSNAREQVKSSEAAAEKSKKLVRGEPCPEKKKIPRPLKAQAESHLHCIASFR